MHAMRPDNGGRANKPFSPCRCFHRRRSVRKTADRRRQLSSASLCMLLLPLLCQPASLHSRPRSYRVSADTRHIFPPNSTNRHSWRHVDPLPERKYRYRYRFRVVCSCWCEISGSPARSEQWNQCIDRRIEGPKRTLAAYLSKDRKKRRDRQTAGQTAGWRFALTSDSRENSVITTRNHTAAWTCAYIPIHLCICQRFW